MIENDVKKLRTERQLSQMELSKIADVSRPVISNLENGKQKDLNLATMKKISKALNKNLKEVFFL